jgi:hypothetical protein
VIRAASGDGEPAVAVVTGAGDHIYPYSITDVQPFDRLDLAIAACPSLSRLPALPLDFDNPLDILMHVSAIGFPMAVEAPWIGSFRARSPAPS